MCVKDFGTEIFSPSKNAENTNALAVFQARVSHICWNLSIPFYVMYFMFHFCVLVAQLSEYMKV